MDNTGTCLVKGRAGWPHEWEGALDLFVLSGLKGGNCSWLWGEDGGQMDTGVARLGEGSIETAGSLPAL
jgi:hypothetical protein